MAVEEFYLTGSGANINAGSTTSNTPSVTSTNGDWGIAAANRFTAASGTPFSGVSVGEWVSISLDAATTAVLIAKITAVNAGGASIDVDATIRFGSAPTTGATGRSARVGGAWLSFAATNSLFSASTVSPISFNVNVKAGSYSEGTNARGFACRGTATECVQIRGYQNTPGDMDDNQDRGVFMSGTNVPAVTFTTGRFTFGSIFHFRNMDVTSASNTASAGTLLCSGGTAGLFNLDRVRVENTSATANGFALFVSSAGNGGTITNCEFKATTTATSCVRFASSNAIMRGCKVIGGSSGILVSGSITANILKTEIRGQAVHGIETITSGPNELIVDGCSIWGAGSASGNGIQLGITPALQGLLVNNILSEWVYGIGGSTNIWTCAVAHNLFHNNSSGNLQSSGVFNDIPSIREQLDTSSPFVNAAGGDLTLVRTSNAVNRGSMPNLDIGAYQLADSPIGAIKKTGNIGTY